MSGIACGDMHSMMWTDDGRLYAWGSNADHSLGVDVSDSRVYTPTLVKSLQQERVVSASCGMPTSVMLSALFLLSSNVRFLCL